jgi:hypothetical protein
MGAILVDEEFQISFHRTHRLPNDGKVYQTPPPGTPFPFYNAERFHGKLPLDMREKGGVILPMWQREALICQFKRVERWGFTPYAIRLFVGGVNCISGETACPSMSDRLRQLNGVARKQDYIVLNNESFDGERLDGIAVAPGIVRQLVALPITSPDSIESQMTGLNDVGGLQLEIIPQFGRSHTSFYANDNLSGRMSERKGHVLVSPEDLGMRPGMVVYRECNSARPRTLLDELAKRKGESEDCLQFRFEMDSFINLKVTDGNNEMCFRSE